jgi:hypothetical protein
MVAGLLLATGTAGVVGIVVLFQAHRLRGRVTRWPLVGWVFSRPSIARFVDSFSEYDRRALLTSITWAFAFTLLLIGANALLGRAVGISQATLLDWAILVPLAALSTLLPSVGGWGVREWTYVGLLGTLDPPVSADTATAVSLLFGGMNLVLAASGALLTAASDTVGLPSIDRIRRDAAREADDAHTPPEEPAASSDSQELEPVGAAETDDHSSGAPEPQQDTEPTPTSEGS